MKELLKNTNISEWFLTGIYKVAIYICWFLFACAFNVFLRDSIDDVKLILLVISLLVLYGIRVFLKNLYKKNANNSYYNLKHAIEMYYFQKFYLVSLPLQKRANIKEIEKYTNTISKERLYSFNYNEGDTLDIIIELYKNNIRHI